MPYHINPERTIPFFGKITYETIAKPLQRLAEICSKNNEDITLIISSTGGDCDAAFAFIDIAMLTQAKIVTIATGNISSVAIPVFCLGYKRIVTKHTNFLFHDLGRNFKENRIALVESEKDSRKLSNLQKWYIDFIIEKAKEKLSKDTLKELLSNESLLLPEEVLKMGIATEIG